MKITHNKTNEQLFLEWDAIAQHREEDIRSKKDKSFNEVLAPYIINQSGNATNVLDIGCGTGILSEMIKEIHPQTMVTGIDPSSTSIKIAKQKKSKITFIDASLEDYSKSNTNHDFLFANMVIMDTGNLSTFLSALYKIGRKSRIVLTLTHPAFWPKYWGYENDEKFDYLGEQWIESNFKTSAQTYSEVTTHIHRPIEMYMNGLAEAGFTDITLDELRGPEPVEAFPYPRFLAIKINSDLR